MKIFVVTGFMEYEYEEPEVAFTTREKAEQYAAEKNAASKGTSNGWDVYEVELREWQTLTR